MPGVVVHIRYQFRGVRCSPAKLKRLVGSVCSRFRVAKATVSIAVVGNAEIRRLNGRFLHRRKTTDCLAFDLSDDMGACKWFELVVNGQRAMAEAAKRGHHPQAELALYVIHGLLHNMGFDDLRRRDATRMHRLEDRILSEHGFGPVYAKALKSHRRSRATRGA